MTLGFENIVRISLFALMKLFFNAASVSEVGDATIIIRGKFGERSCERFFGLATFLYLFLEGLRKIM
jgi:hypothetical protein